MQFLLDRYRILHGAVCIGDLNPQLLHGLIAFFGWGDEPCQSGLQGVGGLICIDTIVGHDTHVQGGIIDRVSCGRENRSRHGHGTRQAVHIQSGVVAGGSEHIRVVACVLKAPMKAIDRSDQPSGNRVQIAAFTCGEVHCRSQSSSGLLRVQTGTGKVQCRGRGVLHPEGGICRSLFHGLVQQLGFLGGVAHRLVGELHGLIDLGKARRACRTKSSKRKRDMRCHALASTLNLAAEFLHLFTGSRNLLSLHGAEVFIFLLQTFQALLGLSDLPLKGIILLLRDCAVLERLIRLLGGFLQRVQLFLGRLNLLLEGFVFLGKQLRVARIELQELFHIFQLGLRIPDFRIDILQSGLELCGIATDLHGNALYSVSHGSASFPASEIVIVALGSDLAILVIVVPALCVHVVHHADGQKIQIPDGDAELYAAEQEQRRCHLPLSWAKFFLDWTSVCTFRPQSSMSCGST